MRAACLVHILLLSIFYATCYTVTEQRLLYNKTIRGRRMVAGSIPDEAIAFFNWPNPSSRTMALESTQPLTEMTTMNLPGGKWRQERKADLTAICELIV
jgi:hypothetical protein